MNSNVRRIYQAWEKCIQSGPTELSGVKPSIVQSWQRCLEMKVDPYQTTSNRISGEELKEKLTNNNKLIDVAKPFMQELYQFVAGSGFAVLLVDTEGYILEIVGDKHILKTYPYLRQGENWQEQYKGTNAMGTILVEQKPLQVNATEHFCQLNHHLTCSAAPIYDPQGRFVGILDLSGDFRKTHLHSLGMVVAAVAAIKNQLSLQQASDEVLMTYNQLNAIVDSMSEGLLSFDKDGKVIRINSVAGKILRINPEDFLDQDITEVFATDEIKRLIFNQKKVLNDYEMLLDTAKGRLHFTTSSRIIRGKNGEISGAVMTIKEIKTVRKLVNQMVGAQARFTFADLIGTSPKLQECIKLAKLAARGNSSILLEGESGTGKEVFVQAVHNYSNQQGAFVAINCAAIPRELIESELFGYEEGAFTGAKRGGRPGKFELANGGTLFLDEIGDMPLDTQVTLLRVLQEKQVVRVGGSKSIPIDLRLIAATNKDLYSEIKKGNFRLDLYYRLNVITLHIPPLRERKGDILILANNFIRKLGRPLGKDSVKLSSEVEEKLLNYPWPGNVRELENTIERALNIMTGDLIFVEHLPDKIKKVLPLSNEEGTKIESLAEMEKRLISRALAAYRGNIARTAEVLGICRNTLYRKIKEYEIELDLPAKN